MPQKRFHYFLNIKKYICIVSFVGEAEPQYEEVFALCGKEVAATECKYIILNLSSTPKMSEKNFPIFVKMQVYIRDSGKELLICGLTPEIKAALSLGGLIRSNEVMPSLLEALENLLTREGIKS